MYKSDRRKSVPIVRMLTDEEVSSSKLDTSFGRKRAHDQVDKEDAVSPMTKQVPKRDCRPTSTTTSSGRDVRKSLDPSMLPSRCLESKMLTIEREVDGSNEVIDGNGEEVFDSEMDFFLMNIPSDMIQGADCNRSLDVSTTTLAVDSNPTSTSRAEETFAKDEDELDNYLTQEQMNESLNDMISNTHTENLDQSQTQHSTHDQTQSFESQPLLPVSDNRNRSMALITTASGKAIKISEKHFARGKRLLIQDAEK